MLIEFRRPLDLVTVSGNVEASPSHGSLGDTTSRSPLKKEKNDPESLADEISKLQKPYEDGSAQTKFISTLLLTRALHFITRVPIQAPAIHRISLIKRQSRRTGGDFCCFIKTLTRYRFTSPATMKNNGKINKGRLL